MFAWLVPALVCHAQWGEVTCRFSIPTRRQSPITRASRVKYKLTQPPSRFKWVALPVCPQRCAVTVKPAARVAYGAALAHLIATDQSGCKSKLVPHTRV